MTRLGISVEGATEREFVSRILRPHLATYGITVTAIDLRGNVSLDKIRGVLPALLGGFQNVSTFYDFYGFKGREARNVAQLEAAIGELVDGNRRERLIPYVQQYEFESLLFSIPQQAVDLMGGSAAQLAEMQLAVRQAGSPERVNDSFETSPSHRMKRCFFGYDKKLHGPEIVALAGLVAIRRECPRFDAWVAKLEQLKSP
jgi:hypothetical protein